FQAIAGAGGGGGTWNSDLLAVPQSIQPFQDHQLALIDTSDNFHPVVGGGPQSDFPHIGLTVLNHIDIGSGGAVLHCVTGDGDHGVQCFDSQPHIDELVGEKRQVVVVKACPHPQGTGGSINLVV